jgi:hypothetical protein
LTGKKAKKVGGNKLKKKLVEKKNRLCFWGYATCDAIEPKGSA